MKFTDLTSPAGCTSSVCGGRYYYPCGGNHENPFFEVNKALISRSSVFMLKPLGSDAIKKIIRNALTDKERGLGNMDIEIEEDALNFLADICDGDARIALNALELAVLTSPVGSDGKFSY